uniref:uncharacterized protein LOC120347079 isoform X2 n=1 Tax=Styela clava TaxID=7725 RepID=UPI00193A069F|nr:uncharacterized protein LOC120347079 isoform X2 [Styela clava]
METEEEHGPPSNQSNQSKHSHSSSNASNHLMGFQERALSFEDFPETLQLNPIQFAKCGFIYNNISKDLTCTGCNKLANINTLNATDNPSDPQFHMEGCQFVKQDSRPTSAAKASVHSNEELTKPYEVASTSGLQGQTYLYNPPMSPQSYHPMHASRQPVQQGTQAASMPVTPSRRMEQVTRVHRRDEGGGSTTSVHHVIRQESHPTSPVPSGTFSSSSGERTPRHSQQPFHFQSNPPSIHSSIQESSNVHRPAASRRLYEPQPASFDPHSSLQFHSSSTENPGLEQILNYDMRVAQNRLLTFQRFWAEENEFRNVRLLVMCGFFCLGQGDAVECFCCHVIVANWSRNDNPRRRHLELTTIHCRFIEGEECGETPLPIEVRSPRSTPAHSLVIPSLQSYQSSQFSQSPHGSPHHSIHSLSPVAHPSLEVAGPVSAPPTPAHGSHRVRNFSNSASLQPVSPVHPYSHAPSSSRAPNEARRYSSSASLQPISPVHPNYPVQVPSTSRAPYEAGRYSSFASLPVQPVSPVHPNSPARALSPAHAPVRAPSPARSSSTVREPYSHPSPALVERSNLMLGFPCENPNNPRMREEHARLQTFTTNPNFRRNTRLRASDRTLAQAGLYYLGEGDKCKCWVCGGGLNNFTEEDDPWTEHAKFYPECEFLLQQRGPGWVTSISVQNPNVQRPNLPVRNQQNLPNVVSSPYPLPPEPHIDDPVEIHRMREEMLQAGMLSAPVQAARAMGFSDERIKDKQRKHIVEQGCCYQSSEPLIDALIGDRQAADAAGSSGGAVGGGDNVIHMDGQTIRFIGPSYINGQLHLPNNNPNQYSTTTTYTSNPDNLMINGQSLDEIMHNAFDHPFFRGEMDHLINNAPVVNIPAPAAPQPHVVFNNIGRNISARSRSPRSPAPAPAAAAGRAPANVANTTRSAPTNTTRNASTASPATSSTAASATSTTSQGATAATTPGSAEERLQALEREKRCKICLTEDAQMLFQPCGHICACFGCAERLQACPVCRSVIERAIRTYRP